MQNPDSLSGEVFATQAEQKFHFLPIEQEDLQAISFYAWLKSKVVKKDYYPVLLDLVSVGGG